jgi:hypothetical protein
MEAILAQRLAFCDFSDVVGFPNPMLSRGEWEGSLPTFKGEDWEVPAKHLLDFHEFIRERQIVHEDVKIKIFRYSLKGAALDWCRSLPAASINSLKGFHDTFNLFCKDEFSADVLFPECCHEYSLFRQINGHEKYDCAEKSMVVEDTFLKDSKVLDDLHFDRKFVDTFDIISNVSIFSNLHKNQAMSFEISDDKEQIAYGSSPGSDQEHHEHHETDREKFQQQLMLASGSAVEQSIYGFIELGNDIHDQQSNEINYEEKQPFDFKKPGKIIHEFYDPVAIWMESLFSVMPYITKFGMMVCSNKHELVAVSLLHILFSFHVFRCVYEDRSSNLLLELFFWKFIYT